MGNGFAETSVNKIDAKKYDENFAQIKWSNCEKEAIKIEPDASILDGEIHFKSCGGEVVGRIINLQEGSK